MKKNENKDLAPGEPAEKGTGKHRTGSLAVKLLCVCAAFILWLYVM